MRRFYQAVVDIIRGGVHPREVALAVSLGLLAGFLSGWNLSLAVVLLVVMVLNVPTKVFSEAWALGWAISWTITPGSFALGRWLLEQTPLGPMLAPWRDHPLLVLFELDRYTLLGGGLIGLIVMLPAAWLAARATQYLQAQFQRIQAAIAAKATWEASVAVRLGCWLIFGDAAKPVPAPAVHPAWIRRRGLLLALCVFAPAGFLGWCFGPAVATRSMLTALSMANQSEVNAGQARLSLADGLLEIEELQVSDPDHPDRDRLRIGYLTAQMRPGPLLRGRVHVDRLMVEGVQCDLARQTRARPYGVKLPEFDVAENLIPEGRLLDGPDAVELEKYISDWHALSQRLARLQEMLRKIEEFAGSAPGQTEEPATLQQMPAGYLAMREARHSFGRPEPKVWIEMAALKGLPGQFGLGAQGSIELTNLSSQPPLTGQPTVLFIKAPQQATQIVATLNLHQPRSHHEVRFAASEINLATLISQRSPRMPLSVQSGTINLVGHGHFTTQEFELTLEAQLRDLRTQVQSQQPLAGLPPQLWNDGLARLDHLEMDAILFGRWSAPQLKVDTDRLAQQYKAQLLAAGQTLLAQAVDEQVARGQAIVQRAIDDSLSHAEEAIESAASKVDSVIAQGEARAAGVVQQVEQGVGAAQQAVQTWQNQFGPAGRFLQEHVAAGALTAPGPQPNQLQPSGASHRRHGPPPFLYGDIVGAGGIENIPSSEPVQTIAVMPTPPVAPAVDGLRQPDAVRSFGFQPPVEVRPAPAGMPVMNRPASFNALPAMMELGYEDRRPQQQPAISMPAARVASRPNDPGRIGAPPAVTVPSRPQQPAATATTEEAPTVRSRVGNWSRSMTDKVKGVVPWGNRSQGAEASASDDPFASAASGTSGATRTATAPQQENTPADTPWYRRFWR